MWFDDDDGDDDDDDDDDDYDDDDDNDYVRTSSELRNIIWVSNLNAVERLTHASTKSIWCLEIVLFSGGSKYFVSVCSVIYRFSQIKWRNEWAFF